MKLQWKKKSQPCAQRNRQLGELCTQHRNDLECSAMARTKQILEQLGFGESRLRCYRIRQCIFVEFTYLVKRTRR